MTKARGRIPSSAQVRWSDVELSHAVSAYLFLLLLQQKGTSDDVLRAALKFVGAELFKNRTADSVKYRMRNISSVLEKDGCESVAIFPPAERVGSKVGPRILGIAKQHILFGLVRNPTKRRGSKASGKAGAQARVQVSALLDALRKFQDEPGIGHNQPPEPISRDDVPDLALLKKTAEELLRALQRIDLSKVAPGKQKTASVKEQRNSLVRIGIKIAAWLGERTNKIIDGLLAGYVAYVTGLMPHLANAISAVGHWLAQLGL